MNQRTVAVLGTARNDFVLGAAGALKSDGAAVTVLARENRAAPFADSGLPVRTFSGRIAWYSLPVLTTLRRIGAQHIAVVVGDVFSHANVTTALNWWRAIGLLRGADIYVSFSTQPHVLECFNTSDQGQRLVAAVVVLLLAALTLRFPVVALLAVSVAGGLELAARAVRGWRAGERPAYAASAWPLLVDDPQVGWRLRPVNITARISAPDAVPRTIRVTVDTLGERQTGSPLPVRDSRLAIAFYGGSYMFGESLSDEETIPWRASTLLNHYRMLNRAVPGYSALQALIRLLDDLTDRPPVAVVAVLDGSEPNCAGNDPSSALRFPFPGHARFPLSDRCALWWWSERVLSRSIGRRRRERVLLAIAEKCAHQRIPIVMTVAGADRTGLGAVLSRCGFSWTAIDVGASHQSTAERLAREVRGALKRLPTR
jgi:hypothetical protein